MKVAKFIYWISTGLLTALMLFSAYNYFFKTEMIMGFFEHLGYPTYLVYPLAIAKILGLVAIWTKLSTTLKEWAYAGFFYDVVLAAVAHLKAGDGSAAFALAGIVFVLASYFSEQYVSKRKHLNNAA